MADETLDAILAEIRGVADNMEVAAKRFYEEHKQDVRCMKHPHCFRHDDLMRESMSLRKLADRIEAAAERERRQLRSLVARFANCHEDNEDFGALRSLARFVLAATPSTTMDGEPVAVLHGRVAEKAGAESCPFVGVDLAKDKPTFVCATIAPGNAAMRDALKRILAIEGYGAPWIEAKCIAQKALECEQSTPPSVQERPQIEQPGNTVVSKPLGRPATEKEVESRFSGVVWCADCSTHCPLSHSDALAVCEHYSAPAEKGGAE